MQDFNSDNYIIHIETLGCRLNQIESESIAKSFIDNNFIVTCDSVTSKTEINEKVCLSIINTCTVTQKAEQKARRIIRLVLKKFTNSIVLVTGCYAQLKKNEIENIDSRVVVFGGQIKSRISSIPLILLNNDVLSDKNSVLIKLKELSKQIQTKIGFPENSFQLSTSNFINHSRASLKIQDGCNSNCSYCAIHIARGKSVSLDCETVLKRVEELEQKGYEEVVITTVNIAQYRSEYNGLSIGFSQLLDLMLKNTQKIHFRISSLYPEIVDDYFCSIITNPRVCPHFHISVQSGSDKILKTMNRAYSSNDVLNACKRISKCKKDVFLACDIITGFPGETDEDFNQTYEFCKKVKFSWIHIFPFSEREGTPAVNFKNKVPQEISRKRAEKLTELAIQNKIEYIQQFENRELDAILESIRNPRINLKTGINKTIYHAVSENFIHCEIIDSNMNLLSGKKVRIKIIKTLCEKIINGEEIETEAIIL
ncbi:MAG: tRNA (N(6)-L-threonylcarbamoyladenosine(37)-C(2))-methylthiotransferase MtaB [Treponema sp.]|nr:tRNA (N(6)-L-threonylcarbamoyladenosine(37)-C(2))-methylthiotransferase MtaB [Treponema sp.]